MRGRKDKIREFDFDSEMREQDAYADNPLANNPPANQGYRATADDVGKKLFLVFAGQSGEGSDTNGFARFDNLVVEVNPSSTGFLIITDIQYAPETAEVTLTWPKTNSSFYRVKYSTDLVDWSSELDDEVLSDRDEKPEDPSQITVTFPLSKGIADQKYLFFRVEE